jgi:hypothetical protein
MVHYGRHIIDQETGLCEICDRGAIHDFHQGKRTGRHFLYSNQDGKFTYRPADDEIRTNNEEPTPRRVRKPLYPEPLPARTRPIVNEESVVVQKQAPRRDRPPQGATPNSSPARPPATFYYVDNTGQMLPRNEVPPDERRRPYRVQNHYSPPTTRPARTVQRRAKTPPPASESWRSRPKRQNYAESEIIQLPNKTKPTDSYYNNSPRQAEMYYIDKPYNDYRYQTTSSLVQPSNDAKRKQRTLEPIERKQHIEPEPTVIRRVYKKLPASKYEPQGEQVPNGYQYQLRPVRKVEKIYPPPKTYETPRTYETSPQSTNRVIGSPSTNKNPSVYYIRSFDEY